MSARILLVDDDPVIRESFPLYFSKTPDLEVVATAANGRCALTWLDSHTCDVVLSDVRMPDMDGVELLKQTNSFDEPSVFVVMTAYDTDDTMITSLARGASGYVIKGQPPQVIIQALRDALNGGTSLSPQCVKRLVAQSPWGRFVERMAHASLTDNEEAVMELLRRGNSNRQIAKELFYSESYIKKIVSSLLKKMDCSSRAELIALLN
ncbi:response regulator transcription factor [Corynebacterium coyleae]|uniref:response regulator n=1 Tax=Corynebacterium coyleae TaxID=53374 RepID=UPI00254BED82|nr:response regulator transcription factor [Corynebacterium coyleae]MDK8822922.1 response regulator transcription factor [Corynebacterium coyleae]